MPNHLSDPKLDIQLQLQDQCTRKAMDVDFPDVLRQFLQSNVSMEVSILKDQHIRQLPPHAVQKRDSVSINYGYEFQIVNIQAWIKQMLQVVIVSYEEVRLLRGLDHAT